MWRHYVYIHKKADSGEVFYVGKGTVKSKHRSQVCERAYCRTSRNKWWCRVVAKHGLVIDVVASFATDKAAQEYERRLIAEYGRKNLVNLTDGGDGHAGLVPSEETRRKLSELAKRHRSEAWVRSIRDARKNGGNGGVVKRGDRLPEFWRARIAAGKVGALNPMYGRFGADHPNSRRVVDRATGAVYDSVQIAAAACGYKMKTLYNWLSGHRRNQTTLEFV